MSSRLDTPLDELVSANRAHRGRGRGGRGGGGPRGRGFGGRPGRGLHRGGRGGRGGFGAKRDPNFSDETVWSHDKFDEHQASVAADEAEGEEEEEGSGKATLTSRMSAIRRTLKNSDGGSAESSAKVRLENLDFNVTDDELKELFSDSGDVLSAKVDYDKSGRSNGTASVVFARRSDALAAVKKYNGVELEGKILTVTIAASGASPANKSRPAAAHARDGGAPRLMISTVNDRFTPRGRGGGDRGFRVRGGGGSRGGRGGGGGGSGRGGSRGPAPTADSLDADLDTYMSK